MNPDIDKPVLGRQLDLLHLAAQGLTDKEIAKELAISTETVRSHWKRLRERFSSSSRTQIVAKGLAGYQAEPGDERPSLEMELLLLETSERKRSEEALKEANQKLEEALAERNKLLAELRFRRSSQIDAMTEELERLRHLERAVESSPFVISRGIVNQHWTKVYMSRNFERYSGIRTSDLLDGKRNPFEFIDQQALADMIGCVEAGLPKRQTRYLFEYRGTHADGMDVWGKEWITFDLDAQGMPTFYNAVYCTDFELDAEPDSSRKPYREEPL